MISVKEALRIIKESVSRKTEILPLLDCLNRVSAEERFATFDVPSFDNSAMDGYVFRFADYQNKLPIKVNTEIQAGTEHIPIIRESEASRIFTGAPIPESGDTVVPQEDVAVENGILIFKKDIQKGANIRLKGTQTRKGSLVLEKDSLLSSENIGFLATLGIDRILVYSKPKVGIMVTGKEIVPLGKPLLRNQIYDSNSVYLKLALKEIGIDARFCQWIDDDKETLKKELEDEAHSVDVLILTGGISVGDYDFVRPVLEELNSMEKFYKVKQKPGKPLYFGNLNGASIFALPGNPSAVVTCFNVYVKPFLKSIMGQKPFEHSEYGILTDPYFKKLGLTHFLKAYVENNTVKILSNQLSYQMDAYAKANALAVLGELQEEFSIGEKVEVIKFGA